MNDVQYGWLWNIKNLKCSTIQGNKLFIVVCWFIPEHSHAHVYAQTHACTHTHTHTETCTHTHTHRHMHTRTDTCTHVHMHTHKDNHFNGCWRFQFQLFYAITKSVWDQPCHLIKTSSGAEMCTIPNVTCLNPFACIEACAYTHSHKHTHNHTNTNMQTACDCVTTYIH